MAWANEVQLWAKCGWAIIRAVIHLRNRTHKPGRSSGAVGPSLHHSTLRTDKTRPESSSLGYRCLLREGGLRTSVP